MPFLSRFLSSCVCGFAFLLPVLLPAAAQAQQVTEPLSVTKIDPPGWYSGLPKPLLLVRGTGLSGAQFHLSDRSLAIEHVSISANGHWAQLQLAASPRAPESVYLEVREGRANLRMPYRFEAPRAANTGMSGFSPRDVLYLVLTDRFADGNLNNDGLDAQQNANSPEALAERAKPRGWHGGDLAGVMHHLDYLQQLGITAVWVTPVYTNAEPQAYHGYHATDYYGVDPHLGTMHDLQELAAALHARGMKLVLDTVPNHVGPGHPWVADEPTPNWFHGTRADHIKAEPNFAALINPHAPDRDREATLHGWFADALPDMDTDDPVVARYLRQNAVWWIEQTGADALRIDTFSFVNRGFWHEFNGELAELFPHLTEVGEVFNPNPEVTSAFADGVTRSGPDTHLYTPFDFPTYFALRDVFAKGKPMSALADVLATDALYPHPERLVPFAGNHDTSRFAEVVSDPALRKLAFAYLFTTRGTPQIYSGDEIALRGGDDPDNRQDFPGGFPSSEAATSAFLPTGRKPDQQETFAWIQQLLKLRREHEVLACGDEQVLSAGQDSLLYTRFGSKGCAAGSFSVQADSLVVLLERHALTPLTVDLHGTTLAGCTPGSPLLGEGEANMQGGQLNILPRSSVLILPCQVGSRLGTQVLK